MPPTPLTSTRHSASRYLLSDDVYEALTWQAKTDIEDMASQFTGPRDAISPAILMTSPLRDVGSLYVIQVPQEVFLDRVEEQKFQLALEDRIDQFSAEICCLIRHEEICEPLLRGHEPKEHRNHDHVEVVTALLVGPRSAMRVVYPVTRYLDAPPELGEPVEVEGTYSDWGDLLRRKTTANAAAWN